MNKYNVSEEPDDNIFLRKLKNPVEKPTPEDPIANPTIIKVNTPNVSDSVQYGFLNTITYQRGIANHAIPPDDETRGYILKTVPRKINSSDGGAPPTLPKGTIGKKIV